MDEEDEEPFSATNSAVVAPGPKQDEPKRPQPGGRFPSQLSIDTLSQRGLQAPLSSSSGGSGFGDVQDQNVVAAATSLPGSGVGHHYGASPSSPTHAALINQQAREDGINPYTSQPIQNTQNHTSNIPAIDGLAAAGVGAEVGILDTEAYLQYQDEKAADRYRQEQEQQAVLEYSTVAAADTQSEQKAAHKAAITSAPDTPLTSVSSGSNLVSGGRSRGYISSAGNDSTKEAHMERVTSIPIATANPIETVLRPLTEDARPRLATGPNHQSVQSISQLHVPGEFPTSNTELGDGTSALPA